MRDNSGRLILLGLALLVFTGLGIWYVLGSRDGDGSAEVKRPWFGDNPVPTALAAPIGLGFGQGGLAELTVSGGPRLAAILTADDGRRTYLAGTRATGSGRQTMFAVRLDAAGQLDAEFGQGGRTDLDFGTEDQEATGAMLDAQGRLVLYGHADAGADQRNMIVARLDPVGFPDPTFDADGLAAVRIADRIQVASAGVVQPDGLLVLAGYVEVKDAAGTLFRDLALVRLRPDGSLDATFGEGGVVRGRPGLASRWQEGRVLAMGPRVELLAAGDVAPDPATLHTPLFFQFLTGGQPDSTFGRDGASRPIARPGIVESLVVLKDGRILAAGSDPASGQASFITRLLPNGTLDPDFGTEGVRPLVQDLASATHPRLHVATDGDLVCVAVRGGQAVALRLNPDGNLAGYLSVLGSLEALPQAGARVLSQLDAKDRLWVATSGGGEAGADVLRVGVYQLD